MLTTGGKITKRIFDLVACTAALVLLCPFWLCIALMVACGSKGGALYRQTRVGRDGREFKLLKFRTMRKDADKIGGLITIGEDDRVTRIGRFLRKYKIDELPQFLNIIKGDMSIVGPRPEVPKYVALYNERQRRVLSVRPGLTDYASIEYISENELLAKKFADCVVYLTANGCTVAVPAPAEGLADTAIAQVTDAVLANTEYSVSQINVIEVLNS